MVSHESSVDNLLATEEGGQGGQELLHPVRERQMRRLDLHGALMGHVVTSFAY